MTDHAIEPDQAELRSVLHKSSCPEVIRLRAHLKLLKREDEALKEGWALHELKETALILGLERVSRTQSITIFVADQSIALDQPLSVSTGRQQNLGTNGSWVGTPRPRKPRPAPQLMSGSRGPFPEARAG